MSYVYSTQTRGPGYRGPRRVSRGDNSVPSVTTARITEHNRGSAAVIPMQAKQQEAVVVDSAVMKLALRQTGLSSVATSAYFPRRSYYRA